LLTQAIRANASQSPTSNELVVLAPWFHGDERDSFKGRGCRPTSSASPHPLLLARNRVLCPRATAPASPTLTHDVRRLVPKYGEPVRALEAEMERLRMASPAASTPSDDTESTEGLTRACPAAVHVSGLVTRISPPSVSACSPAQTQSASSVLPAHVCVRSSEGLLAMNKKYTALDFH